MKLKTASSRRLALGILRAIVAAALLTLAFPLLAQTPTEVLYKQDFQSFEKAANPPGWVDTSIGNPSPVADGLFKTWPDPTQGNKAPNVVYGSKSALGKPEGRNPRIGKFSTLTTHEFDARGRFEFSGRLIRTRDDARVGVTFLSQYPNADKYYLLGLWSQPTSSKLTMQLFAFDKAMEDPSNPLGDQSARMTGIKDSGVSLTRDAWYSFLVRVDDVDGKTKIFAKIWESDGDEPEEFQIVAEDASTERLTAGHIGMWTAVKGDAYIDDVIAKSPVDHTAPDVEFYRLDETGSKVELTPGYLTNQPVTVYVEATDDTDPNPVIVATLNEQPFVSGTTISVEGDYTIVASATDATGHTSLDEEITFYIDTTAPGVIVLEGTDSELEENAVFNRDVSINLAIDDKLGTTVAITLDGEEFTPGTVLAPAAPYGVEAYPHVLAGTVTDDAGNVTTLEPRHFTIDKTKPVISVTRDGTAFSGGAFNQDIAIVVDIQDLTPTTTSITLNGEPYTSGTPISADGTYTIAVLATDLALNEQTAGPISFTINKSGPGVEFLDNDAQLIGDGYYNRTIPLRIQVTNILPPTVTATLDGVDWPVTLVSTAGDVYLYEGSLVASERVHDVAARVTDAAGNDVTQETSFTIDLTLPALTILESGAELSGSIILDRPAVVSATATDASFEEVTLSINGTAVSTEPEMSENGATITAPTLDEDGVYVVTAGADDKATNHADAGPFSVTVDTSAPEAILQESGAPFLPDTWFNHDVAPTIQIEDLTAATVDAFIDDVPVTFTLNEGITWAGPVVSAEGTHSILVHVMDQANHTTTLGPATFHVDKTKPAITLTTPGPASVVTAATLALSGNADDAVSVTVNGVAATIDSGNWTFASLSILEGANAIRIVGTDRAGNVSEVETSLTLDTRGPALQVLTPANGGCTNLSDLAVQGTASDVRLVSVVISVDGQAPIAAQVDAANGTWSATLSGLAEGARNLVITAADSAGHTSTATLGVRIDRAPPVIEVTEGGALFARSVVNRALALFVRAVDADPSVVVTTTLDGNPFVSGSSISGEGSHTLSITARDCAGNETPQSLTFTIDLTAPAFESLTPANGARIGDLPDSITGTVNDASNVTAIELVGTSISTPPSNNGFTLSGVPFAEGTNRFALRATDEAGNVTTLDYVVTVRTELPTVQISENGTPIVSGTLFNRDVSLEIVSSDPDATIAVTLDGAAYTSGTPITTEGTHTLSATATDELGHAGTHSVTFTIDKSAPTIAITSPADGASINGDVVAVSGTANGATSVLVNGVSATLSGTSFSANIPLDLGENLITAVARDEAGNTARADITVTRAGSGPAIVLLYPPDKSLTNRPKTEVLGRVISPSNVVDVEISHLPLSEGPGVRVTPNPAGDFRLSDMELQEGENTITATAIGTDGKTSSVTISLTVDFTAPTLEILANATALEEGARFADSPSLTINATDNATTTPSTTLLIDGAAPPTTIEPGGHVAVATASDAAGNTTRVERTFFVGEAGTGTTGCSVTDLDPSNGSVITSTITRLAGRTSAPAVTVNGVPAEVIDGSFCTSVELTTEGANPIEIVCTSLGGEPIGAPLSLSLMRSTGQPSVAIETPTEGQMFTPDLNGLARRITVTGQAGPGVVSVNVNGVTKSLDGTDLTTTRTFSVENVPLASGLNILAVRGETAAKRGVLATRRVFLLEGQPRISITSSLGSVPTGAATVDVSGTWANLDPDTLIVSGGAAVSWTRLSNTNGTFVATVALASGVNEIAVSGTYGDLTPASATVSVTKVEGAPSIAIATPDNTTTAADEIEVTGTFAAEPGARVEVKGIAATVTGNAFSAVVPLSTVAGSTNPIVARVTELDGDVSADSILVDRFAGEFDVEEAFPASGTSQVPVTFQLLVRLSHDVDRTSVAGNLRLENAAGQAVSGVLRIDRDIVSFAPSAPLAAGETHTLRITTGLRDRAGRALGSEFTSTFTTELGATTAAPQVDSLPQVFCGEKLPVTGTAPAGSRVRLDTSGLTFFTNANASGAFAFEVPVIGAEGYRLLRVRIVGSDGSLSAAAESCIRIECGGPQVSSATYDRDVNTLTIIFNRDIDATTVVSGSTVLIDRGGLPVSGTIAQSSGTTFVVTPDEDVTESSFRLTVTTGVKDTSGNALKFAYTQSFTLGGAPIEVPPGYGFITGEVYDATTGRPLQGATVFGAPTSPSAITDSRGRYAMALPEGAHTIEVTADGHTTVWRQVVVPAGTGIVPIDIRLSAHGASADVASSDLTLTHGGETSVTTPVTLTVPSGSLTTGSTVALTSVGTQSLAGLLPLGWSPLASADVLATDASAALRGVRAPSPATARSADVSTDHAISTPITATLTFTVDSAAITNAAQTLSAVRYDATRDEWLVLDAAVNVSDDTATINITRDGAYALVYPDNGPGLTPPPPAAGGTALVGVVDPCATPGACGELTSDSFVLDPAVVLPDQRTTATLRAESALSTEHSALAPSGTAVQAYIDEELNLADGSTLTDPPFATDLLLYRGLDGGAGEARFHLAPSKKATEVILQVGYEHIRVHPYPGRLDRSTLIGNEGGRVPGDGTVSIDIPEGATPEPVHAEVTRLSDTDIDAWQLEGYTVLGGFDFKLTRATSTAPQDLDGDGQPDDISAVQLFKPASMTYIVDGAQLPSPDSQVILAEIIANTGYATDIVRLTSLMSDSETNAQAKISPRPATAGRGAGGEGSLTADTAVRYTTQLPTTALPLDGLTREGQYLVLASNQPMAYATGLVRIGSPTGPIAVNAQVTTSPLPLGGSAALGVNDLVRQTGIYAIPVPAAGFALTPSSRTLGTGAPHENATAVETASVQNIQLVLTPEPPTIVMVEPTSQVDVQLDTRITIQADKILDHSTIGAGSITLTNALTGAVVSGTVASYVAPTSTITFTPTAELAPNERYNVAVAPGVSTTGGTPIGTHTFTFATKTSFIPTTIDRDAFSITIPDENGVSIVEGAAGSLGENWTVVVNRRLRDFGTVYTSQILSDGGFTLPIGDCHGLAPCEDAVSITDTIDLRIVNASGILTAVIRLTPFVTTNGLGFIAPPDRETRFTSKDNISITVPAGAFEEPTLVSVSKADPSAFAEVPNLTNELDISGTVTLAFEGVAKKRIQLELEPTSPTDLSRQYYLGVLGESIRGPRVMIVDTLREVGGRYTTESVTANSRIAARTSNLTAQPETVETVKESLLGVNRRGTYSMVDIQVPDGTNLAWASLGGLQSGIDLFWDTMKSLFAAQYYIEEKKGSIVVPVPTDIAFEVVGVDATSGLQAFQKAYDPLSPTDPGIAVPIDPPSADKTGPYPTFGTPFRVEIVDHPGYETKIYSVPGLTIELENGFATVRQEKITLPAAVPVTMLNVTHGNIDTGRGHDLQVPASAGDRLVFYIGATEISPDTSISIVFSEPIYTGDASTDDELQVALRDLFTIEKSTGTDFTTANFAGGNLTSITGMTTDSGGRRIIFSLPSSLERGAIYRVRIASKLADRNGPNGGPGLRIGQAIRENLETSPTLNPPLALYFSVRAPGGTLTDFELSQGQIRDLALNGNVLLVSALEGGVFAYDVADPAALTANAPAIGHISNAGNNNWAIASDHHGRVYTTSLGSTWGALSTYRLRDLIANGTQPNEIEHSIASTRVAIAPGANSSLPLGSATLMSDRPEGIPRKLQILLQDEEEVFEGLEALTTAYAPTASIRVEPFQKMTFSIPIAGGYPYYQQTITIENMTAGMSWSADATESTPARLENVIVRANDRVRIIRNLRTYGVVSIFGYGVGVFDLNAVESNDLGSGTSDYKSLREMVRLTNGAPDAACATVMPNYAIPDLTFAADAGIQTKPGTSSFTVFGVDTRRGLLDVTVTPPVEDEVVSSCAERGGNPGLVVRNPAVDYDHPRLTMLRTLFRAKADRYPNPRLNSLSFYRWRLEAADNKAVRAPQSANEPFLPGQRGSIAGQSVTRDYYLVPAGDYGLLVVEVGGTPLADGSTFLAMREHNLVDIIWIPSGAFAVRSIPRTNMAAVVDGEGRVLLVDLTRIDERYDENGELRPYDQLFPTAIRSILVDGDHGIGSDDPRIIWQSETGLVSGTLAPVVDPETGMIYTGKLLEKTMSVVAGTDPRIQIKVDLGESNGLSEVGGVVPLGVDIPDSVKNIIQSAPADRQENASLAAFRLEATLPGAMAESIKDGNLELTIRGETVFGVPATTNLPDAPPVERTITMQRVIPASMKDELRHQRGFNRFISPWIVSIGDPRASERYTWPNGTTTVQKAEQGCQACDRPAALEGKSESDGVFELFSAGRIIAVAPDFLGNPFANTPYAYLGAKDRLAARFSTIPSDTVRTPEVLTAAQGAPVAGGAIQETIYLHSGEVATSAIDLDAGGRNGWNVVIDRTYRSRTIGGSPMGMGWESSIFRRLRALPDGDVEYRDASGEVWRFVVSQTSGAGIPTYTAPAGLFLRLARTNRGWILVDQRWRTTFFDEMGRLIAESDEFRDAALEATNGNVIRYLYDANGRLAQIIDPVGRISTLTYWSGNEQDGAGKVGLLKTVSDWRNRAIDYEYDAQRRLVSVALPDVPNTSNERPTIRYAYGDVQTIYNDRLELEANLVSITDPIGGKARVEYAYDASNRDRVQTETWGTSETVTVSYDVNGNKTTTTDALGQVREATLSAPITGYNEDRVHVATLTEKSVQVASTSSLGQLPSSITATAPTTVAKDRTYQFTYKEGLLETATLDNVRQTTNTWKGLGKVAPGSILIGTSTAPTTSAAARTTSTYLGDTIDRTFNYRGGDFGAAFVSSIEVGGMTVETPELNRGDCGVGKSLSSTNNSIRREIGCTDSGLIRSIASSGGTDPDAGTENTETTIEYTGQSANAFERFLPKKIASAGLETTFDYPDQDTIVTTDPRGVVTKTKLDAWRRPVMVTTEGQGLLRTEMTTKYDANGRVVSTTRKQGLTTVETTWTYDTLGRVKSVKTDNPGGVPESVTTTYDYDLANHTLKTTLPSGAVTTTTIDPMGRTVHTNTKTSVDGSNPIDQYVAYDIDDNVVFSTDTFTASAAAYDIHGRPRAMLYPDGTRAETVYDDFGRATEMKSLDANGNLVAQTNLSLTAAGRVQSVSSKVDESQMRQSEVAWTDRGTTKSVVSDRAFERAFDQAGRVISSKAGAGSRSGVSDVFSHSATGSFSGGLPTAVTSGEKGASYNLGFDYDNLGNSIQQTVGSLEWQQKYDEAGNLVTSQMPNRPSAEYEYDGRGALTKETKPDGAVVKYTYDALGVPTGYTDPTNETTTTTTDLIGRPTLRAYPDGTTESWTYEGPRIKSHTDRQGRTRAVDYNDKGQVVRILGNNNAVLELIDYDDAGRVTRRRNKDSAVEYLDFNLAGQPRKTRQIRYADGTGIIASPTVIDSYEQTHEWNEHGERTGFTMPSYPGLTVDGGWTKSLTERHDAMGNLATIERTLWSGASQTIMSAVFRNAGRPDTRTITTACTGVAACTQAAIVRQYGYDTTTGQLNAMRVASEGVEVVGSLVKYDGVQRAEAILVGLSGGERSNQWDYDARGRLATSSHAKKSESAKAIERLTPSDFRTELDRPETTQTSPKSISFTESATGHKIDAVEKGGTTRSIAWDGSEMVDDGTFVYQFDTYGRLIMVTERSTEGPSSLSVRRIKYTYTPTNRLVGRRAEYAPIPAAGVDPLETDWRLEDRNDILAFDALPAETTFVWNPFADTIDSVFVAGSSQQVGLQNGGLVRQIIHGGLSYDDPIEVTAVDPASVAGALTRLYPVYDEAGAGMLQAILNASGEMVARTFADGAYGEDEYALPGPAVDRIAVTASKDESGALTEVKVSLRLTEQIDETTLGDGLRLAALAADGSMLRTFDATPSLTDNWAAGWTLTAGEWSTLIDGAASISIAATDTLRAARWADTPVLAVPDWATSSKPVFSSAALPVEARESVATLGEWITGVSVGTESTVAIYEVPDLAAIAGSQDVAGDPRKLLVAATFHAHPFHESLTGKNYVRARWYAPELGNFISPDPELYRDSSNLYAFGGGDPVNKRDPTGTREETAEEKQRIAELQARGKSLHDEWEHFGYAEIEVWVWGEIEGLHDARSPNKYGPIEVPYAIEDEYAYENARRMLVADIIAYREKIADAAEGEVVEYESFMKGRLEFNQRLMAGVEFTGAAIEALGARGGGGKTRVEARRGRKKKARGPVHHLATNKNPKSTARGGPWTPKFRDLFEKAGMSMEHAFNKYAIPGHKGPHPREYHQAVYDRLLMATQGLSGTAYRQAFQKELQAIGVEASTPGSSLNRLLRKK